MFVAPRDVGSRRRSRLYGTSRSARSSRISLLTINTSSSGGSNSTVTQESYNRSHGKTSHRRRRTREHRSRSQRTQCDDGPDGSQAEVFDYLVENEYNRDKAEMRPNPRPEVEDENNVESSISKVVLHQEDEDVEGFYRSMSDSGISMGSSSSGPSISGSHFHTYLPILPEEPSSRPGSSHNTSSELAIIDPRWAWHSSSPVPHHDGHIPPPVPQPPNILFDNPLYPTYPYIGFDTPSPEANDCDLIPPKINIREPSDQHLKPAYFRAFTKISTRLLLQMQDEIAEMEEEVMALDEDSDDADDALEHELLPDMNARRNCKIRREHLYEALHVKLDQYYHALEMVQKMEKISKPAATGDRSIHKEWLESRIFPSSKIPRLVQSDLRAFECYQPRSLSTTTSSLHIQHLAYSTFINTFVPLAFFKLTNNVLNRLLLLSLITAIGASVQARWRTRFTGNDLTCTIFCICVSLFAAICL